MKSFLSAIVLLMIASGCQEKSISSEISLIPKPDSVTIENGYLIMGNDIRLEYDSVLSVPGRLLKQYLTSFDFTVNEDKGISVLLKPDPSLEESVYHLIIDKRKITLHSAGKEGAFNGVQTIRQLLFQAKYQQSRIPIMTIEDAPNYQYRGMHLDVARHFMPLDFIKKYIDILALHKMNYFHWHLADDQGWRIEIKKYPLLTEVGSFRKETMTGHYKDHPRWYDNKPHKGYYTQQEVKDVVKYAQNRGVNIIPEIELPGHARAAIASYPWLGCTNDSIEVWAEWGISPYIYNINDTTFSFLETVFDEIIELFPCRYIHIGGDEALKDQWKESKTIQGQMKKLGIENETALQSYFINRIASYLKTKSRIIIGWDEILEGGAPKDAVIMNWRNWVEPNPAVEAANHNHNVILTPIFPLYFDFYQSQDKKNEPLANGGFSSVDSVYLCKIIPSDFPEEKTDLILGFQANLWTEYIPTTDHAEYMLLPRMSALAERLWTDTKHQNLHDFKNRFVQLSPLLDSLGVNYARHIFQE